VRARRSIPFCRMLTICVFDGSLNIHPIIIMILLPHKKLLTLEETGRHYSVMSGTLAAYVREGRLSAEMIGGELYVEEKDADIFFRNSAAPSQQVFVARQPIFNTDKKVMAYELLFRSSLENMYDTSVALEDASASTISSSFNVIGMDKLTNNKKAFINLTKNLLVRGVPHLLPKGLVVVEILEDVQADDDVVLACQKLKDAGFILALDDFVYNDLQRPLIELADIIKIDFLLTTGDERQNIIDQINNPDIRFLAEKVETFEDYQQALDLGYSYFQGYFFSKPFIVQGRDIPVSKLNFMRLIREVNRPELGFEKLEQIIKHDLSLSYKLLRLINSSFFGFSSKVESIRHALVLLGEKEIRKWSSLLALNELAYDKPEELVNVSVIRARFCESLSEKYKLKMLPSDCFLLGMFSLIDALVDKPMQDILTELPIAKELKDALLGEPNIFHDLLLLVVSYEKGFWEELPVHARKLSIRQEDLPEMYMDAVTWSHKML